MSTGGGSALVYDDEWGGAPICEKRVILFLLILY